MFFYDDDDDNRSFYKNKLLVSAEKRSAFEQTTSYRDRNDYATTKIKFDSEIKFKSSCPLYTPPPFVPKVSTGIVNSGCVTPYKDYNNPTPFKGSAEIINSERMFLRDYRSNGSASLDCTLYDNHESKISAEIANKDDTDFKIEAKARGMTESNIDGIKTKIEADCSGLWDIKNNDFKYKAKARGMTESNIDGATAKIEAGGSYSFENKGSKTELDFKSSIQNDDLTFFQSEGLVKVDDQLTNVKLSSTLFRAKDESVDIKFLSAAAESKVGKDKDSVSYMEKVGVNLIEADIKGFKAKVGINLDTGVSVNNDTIEAKYEGFGFKVGKEISLSTPVGELSVDLQRISN